MYPNKFTKLFVSVSKNPGNTGAKFHNTGYKIHNLNCIYIPLKLKNLKNFKKLILKFNINGCSISMPFKQEVVKYLDYEDKSVSITKNVNTLLIKNGKIKGFNTDYNATEIIIKKINLKKTDTILLLGNGGVSRTIYEYLKKIDVNTIFISSRNIRKFNKWKLSKNTKILSWKVRNNYNSSLLINATSIGMTNKLLPISRKYIANHKSILDLVIYSKSSFKKIALEKKVKFYDGLEFSFYQACKQFEIYNNIQINKKLMIKKLNYKF